MNRIVDGLISDGFLRMKESTEDVFVMRGMLARFAVASARNALRIVEPSTEGSGEIGGFVAGDLLADILKVVNKAYKLYNRLFCMI